MLTMRHPGCDEIAQPTQADILEKSARRLAQARNPLGRRPEPKAVGLGGLNGQGDVPLCGETVEDAGDLERPCQPEPRAAGGRKIGDVPSIESDPSGIRPEFAGQLSDQRGLARTVRSDERMSL